MAPRLPYMPGLEIFSQEEELLAVPYVELYEVEKVGGYKYPQYAGPAFITRLGGGKDSRSRRSVHIHVGPEWSLQLHSARTCLEAAPGVVLLSGHNHSDPEGTFFLIAVGTTESDQACVAGLESLLKETCAYLVTNSYDAAAEHMGVRPDDPKLLGLSSSAMAAGMAKGSQGIAWGLNAAGNSIGNGISGGAKWATSYIPAAAAESSINPAVQKGIGYTSKAAMMTRNGIIWGIKSSVEGVAGLVSGSSSQSGSTAKPKKPTGKAKSESVKALAKIGGQTVHSLLDVMDAMEDSVGSVVKGTADATTILVKHRHGDGAAQVTDDVFKATGSLVGTALGYRLYRRPEDGPLATKKVVGSGSGPSPKPPALPPGTAVMTKVEGGGNVAALPSPAPIDHHHQQQQQRQAGPEDSTKAAEPPPTLPAPPSAEPRQPLQPIPSSSAAPENSSSSSKAVQSLPKADDAQVKTASSGAAVFPSPSSSAGSLISAGGSNTVPPSAVAAADNHLTSNALIGKT